MLEAFFLPVEPGQRLCIFHHPAARPTRGGVVYVHPFAEEMHKARRMAALQARRLADEGFAVMQIDLHGCGDSTGDFSEARWDLWKRDVLAAMDWLKARTSGPLALWGLRLGALLAAEVAQEASGTVEDLVLWHPVSDGGQFLTQFLRLRLASEMLAGGTARSAVRELTAQLAKGEVLEIAGYEFHPELATEIGRRALERVAPRVRRVHWLEVVADSAHPLRPASRRVLDTWRAQGVDATADIVQGDPFWSTIEIAECPELLVRTSAMLGAAR